MTTDGLPQPNRRAELSPVRSRIPLILAGLLIIALVATIGLAAFTPGGSNSAADDIEIEPLDIDLPISGRVASAVLALAVAPVRGADLATSTTLAVSEASTSTTGAEDDTLTTTEESTLSAPTSSSSTTAADTTTTATEAAPTPTAASDTTPPALQVLSPKDGATVTSRVIEFTGVTERGAEVFSGPFEAETDAQGDWAINLVLAPGANGASFTARDAAGNETSVRIVVTYDAPDSTTTTKASSTTTEPSSGTPTTTEASATTTTTKAPSSGYSPQWPADSGGRRNVENWRSTVAQYWPADRVDCVLGIIYRESGGDPTARNASSNALGLMQHLGKYWPSRAAGAGFVDSDGLIASPYNGAANIAAGKWVADWAEQYQGAWWKPWSSLPSYGSCGS